MGSAGLAAEVSFILHPTVDIVHCKPISCCGQVFCLVLSCVTCPDVLLTLSGCENRRAKLFAVMRTLRFEEVYNGWHYGQESQADVAQLQRMRERIFGANWRSMRPVGLWRDRAACIEALWCRFDYRVENFVSHDVRYCQHWRVIGVDDGSGEMGIAFARHKLMPNHNRRIRSA